MVCFSLANWLKFFSINQVSNQVLTNIKVVELIIFYNSYFGQISSSVERFRILGSGSLNQKCCSGVGRDRSDRW